MGGVRIKATITSKTGPDWEQELLKSHKQKILVSIPREANIEALSEKLEEKFLNANLADLNADTEYLLSLGIERITGAKIKALGTKDGYDIDQDSSLEDLFGEFQGIEMEVQAEVDLACKVYEPPAEHPACCTIS